MSKGAGWFSLAYAIALGRVRKLEKYSLPYEQCQLVPDCEDIYKAPFSLLGVLCIHALVTQFTAIFPWGTLVNNFGH